MGSRIMDVITDVFVAVSVLAWRASVCPLLYAVRQRFHGMHALLTSALSSRLPHM